MLNFIGLASSVGMGCAFLWHFSNIARFGSQIIYEPNPYILWGEIVGITALVILSLYCMAQILIRMKRLEG